ncbi:MAG: YfhO family protein [Chitinophagales bacterium]|nr:YfhO family protein [Chitinophagales bacterium]
MNNLFFKERLLPHLIAVAIFTLLSAVYLAPLLSGERLEQHDYVQAMGQQHEITEHVAKTGEQTLWTNSMFSGMPSIQIWLAYPANLIGQIGVWLQNIYIHEIYYLFMLMLGFYIMLFPIARNHWIGIIGSIAFAFGSFNLISIEAGHLNKVWAMAYIAPILGGLFLAFRGNLLTGASIFAVFLSLQLRANHFQITYYTFIACVILGLYFIVEAILKKQLPVLGKAVGILALGTVLAAASNTTQLWGTWDYAKATIRGGKTELTTVNKETSEGGLDKEYAFRWSYGIDETMTLILPNFKGGGSSQDYAGSEAYDKLFPQYVNGFQQQYGMSKEQAEKSAGQQLGAAYYFGDQPFTSGPVYFGVIVCFLFVLGLFIVKSPVKWALLAIAILSIMMSWGSNFSSLNYFLFDTLPMFNKFRTPSMILTLTNVVFVFLAFLAVKELYESNSNDAAISRGIKIAVGITLGVLIIFGFLGSMFMDFKGSTENADRLSQAGLLEDIIRDRKALLRQDAIRAILLLGICVGLIQAFLKKKLQPQYFLAGLGLLVLVDLWTVDKRYFSSSDFVSEAQFESNFKPSEADLAVLQDKDPNYRVLDMTGGIWQDAMPSYFHKSIGGYHAAKLRIYQELIERQLTNDLNTLQAGAKQGQLPTNLPALNMLNARYFIFGESAQQVAVNSGALGNAWFVQNIKWVKTADEEMASLGSFNPKVTAIMRSTFEKDLSGFTPSTDTSGSIQLTSYQPDYLTYTSKAAAPQLAVFSEIWYKDGKDWQAYIDGKPVPHLRANYVLRALQIPAGEHKIEFRFQPAFYAQGNIVSLIASLLILGLIGFTIYRAVKTYQPAPMVTKTTAPTTTGKTIGKPNKK